MKHVGRAALLLLLVIGVVLVLKWALTPETFGQFGAYRGANVAFWRELPVEYVGSATCQGCHADQHGSWNNSQHRSVNCETCHGPAREHVERPTEAALQRPVSREACARCHDDVRAKPAPFAQIDAASHGGEEACVSCHSPHRPRLVAPGGIPDIPHSLQGLSDCRLCHLTERTRPFPEDHEDRPNESCLHCHDPRQ